MNVVVDANLVVALVLPLPYSDQAVARFAAWKQAGVDLLAPVLFEYEVIAVLRKAVVAGLLTTGLAGEAMRSILALHVQCVLPTLELHSRALYWAECLGHTKTCDAHYLALAEQRQAELWTADRRLANSARQEGVAWLRWVGEAAVGV